MYFRNCHFEPRNGFKWQVGINIDILEAILEFCISAHCISAKTLGNLKGYFKRKLFFTFLSPGMVLGNMEFIIKQIWNVYFFCPDYLNHIRDQQVLCWIGLYKNICCFSKITTKHLLLQFLHYWSSSKLMLQLEVTGHWISLCMKNCYKSQKMQYVCTIFEMSKFDFRFF